MKFKFLYRYELFTHVKFEIRTEHFNLNDVIFLYWFFFWNYIYSTIFYNISFLKSKKKRERGIAKFWSRKWKFNWIFVEWWGRKKKAKEKEMLWCNSRASWRGGAGNELLFCNVVSHGQGKSFDGLFFFLLYLFFFINIVFFSPFWIILATQIHFN